MKRLRAATAAVLLAVTTTAVAAVTVASPAAAEPVICDTFGGTYIQGDTYRVQNNVWGADTAQCIDVNQNGGFTVTQADHNKATDGAPASYPSIYAGCHYAQCTSGSGLPMQASDPGFASVTTGVNMTYPDSGTWNAAYDLWFDPTPRTDGQNTGAEMMVWLNRRGSVQPIGSPVGTVNLAGATWEVWFGNTGWNVISYLRTSPTTSVNFHVETFYADAVSRGYAERSWYLTSVQAGFEPWIGGAGLAVNSFSYSTDGQPPPTTTPPTTTPPTTTPPTTQPPPGGGDCTATGTVQSEWDQGYVMQVSVTNSGDSPISGWSVGFSLPGGHEIGNAWNADVSGGGTVTADSLAWNGQLDPGQSAEWGFQASRNSGGLPSGFSCSAS